MYIVIRRVRLQNIGVAKKIKKIVLEKHVGTKTKESLRA